MAEVNITNVPEEGATTTPQTTPETNPVENQNPDVGDLLKQIADLKVELNKSKKARDKALSETGEYKKQLRAKMSADEQAEEERRELEEQQKEYIASLEKFKAVAEATARYALQGMGSDMAKQAADAEISGDMDLLSDIQNKHFNQMLKAKEAEWLKSRPQVNVGGGGSVTVTQEQFDKMNMIERTRLLDEHPDVYKTLLDNSK